MNINKYEKNNNFSNYIKGSQLHKSNCSCFNNFNLNSLLEVENFLCSFKCFYSGLRIYKLIK